MVRLFSILDEFADMLRALRIVFADIGARFASLLGLISVYVWPPAPVLPIFAMELRLSADSRSRTGEFIADLKQRVIARRRAPLGVGAGRIAFA